MSSRQTLEKIKTRGHWFVKFEPSNYLESRIAQHGELSRIIRQSVVSSPGREFPWYREEDLIHAENYIESGMDRDIIKEFWRFYQSGQFVWWGGIWSEWRHESAYFPAEYNSNSGTELNRDDVILRYYEIFEFSGRLATKIAPLEKLRLSCGVSQLRTPTLVGRLHYFFPEFPKRGANIPDIEHKDEYSQIELATNSKKLAERAANNLFDRFNDSPLPQEIQEVLRRQGFHH